MKRLVFVLVSIGAMSPGVIAGDFLPTAPPGFTVTRLASVTNARQMALSPTGLLYVGSMEAGLLSVVKDGNTQVLLKNLNYPTGILWHEGDLFLAEISRLSVIRGVDRLVQKGLPLNPTLLKSDWPTDLHHGWKYLALGPDEKLYVGIGAPCNVCLTRDPYGAIHRLNLDGSGMETLARGIRNTVGFTFHPKTKALWFSEMGRDLMGDDTPPDEINILRLNAHYGFPYLHGKKIKDPRFFARKPATLNFEPPIAELPAHSAPIGLVFTDGSASFAKKYPGCFFVALHGSWNRRKKTGYAVKLGCPDQRQQVAALQPFLEGMLQGETTLGRPVDLRFDASGALLVSDDHAGAIWRVEARP